MVFKNLADKLTGFGRKAKAAALAGVLATGGAVSDAYSQVVLSFSGPTDVQVGVPTQYNFVINTASGTSPVVSTNKLGQIQFDLGLTNSGNATINSVTTPASNNAFNGFTTTNDYSNFNVNSVTIQDFGTATNGPSNVNNQYFGTATVTFNQPGSFTWSYDNAVVKDVNITSLTTSFSQLNVTASAIPEPSTYAAIFGAGAFLFALFNRKRTVKSAFADDPVDTYSSRVDDGKTYVPSTDAPISFVPASISGNKTAWTSGNISPRGSYRRNYRDEACMQ